MATFELRRNRHGDVVALRVKLRLAGLPHLSRTFAIQPGGQPSRDDAMAAAERWAQEMQALRNGGAAAGDGGVARSFERASRPPARRPRLPFAPPDPAVLDRALAAARTPADQALLRFVLETGLPPDVLARLRWQHVQIAARQLEVPSLAGPALRQVPLGTAALEALLALGGRKYGLVFKREARTLQALLHRCAQAAGQDDAVFARYAAWRLMGQHGLDAAATAACIGVQDLASIAPTRRAAVRAAG